MTNYKTYKLGQITKYEAGTLYRANKEGNIKALPETTKMLYDETSQDIRLANSRYSQDRFYYDRIYKITEMILEERYDEAQEIIGKLEANMIENAGKKSSYFKYR